MREFWRQSFDMIVLQNQNRRKEQNREYSKNEISFTLDDFVRIDLTQRVNDVNMTSNQKIVAS
jgi:hypothetical protein